MRYKILTIIIFIINLVGLPALSYSNNLTSLDLINSAFKKMEINSETAILYKYYSVVIPEKLPSKYRSSEIVKSGTTILKQVQYELKKLPEEKRKALPSYLQKYSLPLPEYYGLDKKLDTTNFQIYYTTTGTNSVSTVDENSNSIPDYVEWAGNYSETSYQKIVNNLGYSPPPKSSFPKYRVYLRNISPYYGMAEFEDGDTLITVDSKMTWVASNDDPEGKIKGAIKVTIAHEFFHTVKASYNWQVDYPNYWFDESTSTWAEEVVFPQVNDYIRYLPEWFLNPEKSLDDAQGLREYGSCIFSSYLDEKIGRDIIKKIWERLKNANASTSLPHIKTEIEQTGRNFSDEFRKFTVANYLKDYIDGAKFPDIKIANIYTVTSDTFVRTLSKDLPHLASNYYEFTPNGVFSLPINFDGEDSSYNLFALTILKRSGLIWQQEEIILTVNTQRGYSICSEFGSTYDKLVLIVNNILLSDSQRYLYDYYAVITINYNLTKPIGSAQRFVDKINLQWTAQDTNIVGYKIFRGEIHDKFTILATLGNVNSFDDTNVVQDITYYYIITAIDNNDNISKPDNVLTVRPSDVTPPSAINNLQAGNSTDISITLTWTAVGDDGNTGTATSYDIRYSTSNITDVNWNNATQVEGEPIPKIAGSSETFTVTGLSLDTTYYFAIKVADEVPNISELSNVILATTLTFILPYSPTNLFTTCGDKQASLFWSASVKGTYDIQGYNIHRATTSGSNYTKINTMPITTTSYTDVDLTNGTKYYYVVRAVDIMGNESLNSIEINSTPYIILSKSLPSGLSIFSIPLNPANDITWTTFGINKVARWDTTNSKYIYLSNEPTNPLLKLQPGSGFWIKIDAEKNISVNGLSKTTVSDDGYYHIQLKQGWNMIGNPFDFNVSFFDFRVEKDGVIKTTNEATNSGWFANYAWTYRNSSEGWRPVHNKLVGAIRNFESWYGYFVYAMSDCELLINDEVAEKQKEDLQISDANFVIIVSAKAGDFTDNIYLGISDEFSEYRMHKPKAMSPYVEIRTEKGAVDFRSQKSEDRRQKTEFDFEVETDIINTNVTIILDTSNLPKGYMVKIVDSQQSLAISNSGFTYNSGDGGARKFKLIVEKPLVEIVENQYLTLSEAFTYPNPYRTQGTSQQWVGQASRPSPAGITFRYRASGNIQKVIIEVYNLAGRLVDRFEDISIDGEINWNFADKLANGVYVYRITISDGKKVVSKTGKLVVLK